MEKHQSGTGNNGFLFGFLVGLAVALLFTTKKGRSILRNLIDHGWDKLENWEDILKDVAGEDEDVVDGDDYVIEEKQTSSESQTIPVSSTNVDKPIEVDKKERIMNGRSLSEEEHQTQAREIDAQVVEAPSSATVSQVKSTARRFFRGIPKRN
jgi:hypothetical protein